MSDDNRIDGLVRDASDRPVHVARLTTGVMAQLPAQASHGVWFGPGIAAFMVMLLATPMAILQYPVDTDGEYAGSIALGDAETLDADLASLFVDEVLE
jgi:hypothetical protein